MTNDVGGYCEIHRQQHAGDGWRNYQPGKTRQERGYGRPWEIKRARIMKRDKYLCQNCRRDGIATKASSVDHIIPKAHGGMSGAIVLICPMPAVPGRYACVKSLRMQTVSKLAT